MIIFGENILLELKRTRVRMFVRPVMIVMMIPVSIVRVIMMMIAMRVACLWSPEKTVNRVSAPSEHPQVEHISDYLD